MLIRSPKFQLRNRQVMSGFTLIELLIAISISMMLAVLAVPSFRQWINNSQTRTVAESIQNALRLAQSEASRKNRQVSFFLTGGSPVDLYPSAQTQTPSATGKNFMLLSQTPTLAAAEDTFIQGGDVANIAPNVVITLANITNATVTFNSLGRVTPPTALNAPPTFWLKNPYGNRRLTVTVDVSGRILMCDPNRPATQADGCPPGTPVDPS